MQVTVRFVIPVVKYKISEIIFQISYLLFFKNFAEGDEIKASNLTMYLKTRSDFFNLNSLKKYSFRKTMTLFIRQRFRNTPTYFLSLEQNKMIATMQSL